MRDSNYKKTCAHLLCNCEPEPGSDYCGPQCEKAGNETDCPCGHPECGAKA